MQRVSSYLKMRVLGAIESAPGESIVARIRHISEQVFVDEDGQRFGFTWRTIETTKPSSRCAATFTALTTSRPSTALASRRACSSVSASPPIRFAAS